MVMSRRDFLMTATASFGALVVPTALLRARPARATGSDPVLVTVYLRGGADALSLVPPYGDPIYYASRPHIQVAPGTELDLDGFFGFHPALAPLHPLYPSGRLAVVHCLGSANGTRSHFDEQDFMEYAAPGDKSIRVGWLNRFLSAAGATSSIEGVTMSTSTVKALSGPASSLAIPALSRFNFGGFYTAERRQAIQAISSGTANSLLGTMGLNTLSILELVDTVDATTNVVYPSTSLGDSLKDLAALIKADIGVRVAAVNHSSWDHHANELQVFPTMAGDLAGSLAAFANDLGGDLDRTVVLVMSEFGRRLAENGAHGCDHGHGGIMMALGGAVAGGRVLLRDDAWPGLAPDDLYHGIDLPGTTDFRDVFAEMLDRHMGLNDPSPVFPNYTVDPARYPGFFG
jgi:uncharacterized protein (DUF1501 family)